MKAKRIRVIKDFQNKKVGQILDMRLDLSTDLVRLGLCEWVEVEVETQKVEIGKPVEVEPEKPFKVFEPEVHEPEFHNDDLAVKPKPKRTKKATGPKENK